jgi:glycosyltransferase involved in cell wall biosynthesis
MNILEIIDDLGFGGAERVLTNLALELSARGHSVHIACLRSKGESSVTEEEFRAADIRITEFNKADGFSISVIRRLCRYIRRESIDIVHTHNPLVHHYGALAARLTGRPVINTVHGTATLQMQEWARLLFRSSWRVTSRVVSVCRAAAGACRDLGLAPGKSAVIHNGIQLDEYIGIPVSKPNGCFVFGAIGRLVPVKDHANLLHAFAQLRTCRSSCRLEILGDGPLLADLRQMTASLGLENAVKFHGSSRDVAGFLAGIDCFVMSSKSEGLPMSMLEAMAAARPVVATSVGAIPELISSTGCGWLCRPTDAAELERSLFMAVEANDLGLRGYRARSYVLENYSAARMADEYIRLFQEVLAP